MSVNYSQKKRNSSDPENLEENIPNPNDIIHEESQEQSQKDITKLKEKQTISSGEVNINIENVEQKKEDEKKEDKENKKKTTKRTTKREKTKKNEENNEKSEKDNLNRPQNKKLTSQDKEKNYLNQISTMEGKIKELENNHINNMIKLSEEGKNIDAKLKAISKENKSLTSNLESLSSKLDEMILKATSNPRNLMRQKKLDEQKKAENDKKFQLEIKNKEIQNKQKLIDILQKDNLKLKSQMEKINHTGLEENENKIMDDLIKKNKEISELEAKIRDFKLKIEEHNKCDSTIETLNKLIENNKRDLEMRSSQIIKQQKKNLELNTKLTMADKA